MEIELSEDLQHYKESIAMGLNVKQLIYSVLSIGAGAGTVLLLYDKIGITASCYVATPIVAPLALTGFYNYNGLTFWQHMKKIIGFSFFNRPLVFYNHALKEMKSEYLLEEKSKGKEEKKKRKKKRVREILFRMESNENI